MSLEGIRYAVSGAMNLPPELVAEWEEASGGFMVEGYGLTECAPLVSCNPLNDTRRAGSIGVPFPSTDIRVVDPETGAGCAARRRGRAVGSAVRSVSPGYWKREDETRRRPSRPTAGCAPAILCAWTRTTSSRSWIASRKSLLPAGSTSRPTEVEAALKQHDSVADAAVVGIPQAGGGEMVVAAVVPAAGHAVVEEHTLREHCYCEA